MALKIVTGEVRLSFPHVFSPHAFNNEEPKYSVMLLIPKSDEKTIKKLRDAEAEATQKGVAETWGGKKPREVSSVIKDGDEDGSAEDYPERAGHYYMTVRSNRQPQVVDKNVERIIDPEEVYSGVYGRVSLAAFPFKHSGNTGVSFALNNVQITREGESLAGGSTAEDDFDAFGDDEFDDIL